MSDQPVKLSDEQKKELTWSIVKECLKFFVRIANKLIEAWWPDTPIKVAVTDGRGTPGSDPDTINR